MRYGLQDLGWFKIINWQKSGNQNVTPISCLVRQAGAVVSKCLVFGSGASRFWQTLPAWQLAFCSLTWHLQRWILSPTLLNKEEKWYLSGNAWAHSEQWVRQGGPVQEGPLCLCNRRPGAWWLMSSYEIRMKAEARGGKGRKISRKGSCGFLF